MDKDKFIWYRLGDCDDYHCVDGIIELAEALKWAGVTDNFEYHKGRLSDADAGFTGWNYISAYWGDSKTQTEATEWLSAPHVAVIRKELECTT